MIRLGRTYFILSPLEQFDVTFNWRLLMSDSFSGHEILDMAVQIEQKGFEFYEMMQKNAKSVDLKELYGWLKNEEKGHIKNFQQIRSSINNLQLTSEFSWQESLHFIKAIYDTRFFSNNVDRKTWSQELIDEVGAIQIAISFEKDCILFMEELRSLLSGIEEKIICDLIQEEKEHVVKLLNIKNSLLRGLD